MVTGLMLLLLVAGTVVVLMVSRDHRAPSNGPTGGALVSAEAMAGLPADLVGWRIRYRTTDGRGHEVEATGAVYAAAERPDSPSPVLAVAHGSTGVVTACAPSRAHLVPMIPSSTVLGLVSKGWVAVQSDYIGLGVEGPEGVHPYLDGESEARAVLDSVRATRKIGELDVSARTLISGTSQGGHAALFAGAMLPSYAPELDLLGVAAAAPATDLAEHLARLGATPAGLVVASYLAYSWHAVHPDEGIRALAADWDTVTALASTCGSRGPGGDRPVNPSGKPVFDGADLEGPLRDLLARNTPTGKIDAPVLIAQGTADQIITADVQQSFVAARCDEGQRIDYRHYRGLTHASLVAADSPFPADLARWAQDRLAGLPATPTC